MASGTASSVVVIIVAVIILSFLGYYLYKGSSSPSQGSSYQSLDNSSQAGGKNRKRIIGTSGIYLLLVGIVVGYIMSKIM